MSYMMSNELKKNLNPSTLIYGFMICVGLYFILEEEDLNQVDSAKEESVSSLDSTAIEKRIKERTLDIQMKKNIQTQKILSNALDAGPVDSVNTIKPDISSLDMELNFPEDQMVKALSKDLSTDHLDSDAYEDPESVIHRQMEYYEWVDKYLEEKNEKEKRKFIKHFIKTAKEQGYNVRFKEGSKVVLEPIKNTKKNKPLDKLKINWK